MQRTGISSSCFYPLITEASFAKLCERDIRCIEIFFNSPSELKDSFINEIKAMKDYYDVVIPSVHPFMSFAEGFYLFSTYERRFTDILDLYKRFFEVMNRLDSKVFIIHGTKKPGIISDDEYLERFYKLLTIGKEFNISVCQENVVYYSSESLEFLKKMKLSFGDDAGFVLDIKQCRRANENPFEFIKILNSSIKHIHLSDGNSVSTCLPPTYGDFNFNKFFNDLSQIGYDGRFIIELYNNSYDSEEEIYDSYQKINKILVDYFQ